MATAPWAIPTGKAITGSTYIKDTDNNIAATIEDLVDWCNNANGTYNDYTLTGLRTDFLSVSTAQAITSVKTVDTLGAIDFTGGQLRIGGVSVTSTAAELNILDGVTATTAELNILDGVTATATEINVLDGISPTLTALELSVLDGVTATTAELNILDGVTATASELNVLDGIVSTVTELNYTQGVTSGIQPQIDSKAPSASPAFTGVPTAPTPTTGDNTTKIATTAFVQATATITAGWLYESAELSVPSSAGTTSAIHGLGRLPYDIEAVLRCKVAEDGWLVGDELPISDDVNSSGRRNIWKNSTEVGLTTSYAITAYTNKTTGAAVALTDTNWALVLRAK